MKKTQKSFNSTFGPPKKRMKFGGKLNYRAKTNEGWMDVARLIWTERLHECEACHVPISDPQPINFSHLLPRGAYRRYKRDPRNIRIKCAECHTLWHDKGPTGLRYTWGWIVLVKLYDELRDEANGIAP